MIFSVVWRGVVAVRDVVDFHCRVHRCTHGVLLLLLLPVLACSTT